MQKWQWRTAISLLGLCLGLCIAYLILGTAAAPSANEAAPVSDPPLPALKKSDSPQHQAGMLDSVRTEVENETLDQAKQAEYIPKLVNVQERIKALSDPFLNIVWGELPEGYQLKVHPPDDVTLTGTMFRYFTDQDGQFLVTPHTIIWDFGQFTSTFSGFSPEGDFKQNIQFKEPYTFYHDKFMLTDSTVRSYDVAWTANGSAKNAPDPEPGKDRLVYADLEFLAGKQLKKGDTFTSAEKIMHEPEITTTCKVLGAATVGGKSLIGLELENQGLEEVPGSSAEKVSWQRVRRVYLDAQTSIPFRIEYATTKKYPAGQVSNPELQKREEAFGGIPPSGVKTMTFIYQLFQ